MKSLIGKKRKNEYFLTLSPETNSYFEDIILSGNVLSASKEKDKAKERLRKAYIFFNDRIKEQIEDFSLEEKIAFIGINNWTRCF